MFLKVLLNYQESIVENELTIPQAWGLCHAICQARYDKGTPLSEITNNASKEVPS